MRQADLLRLSLSALYQQKLRTLLTMLGVLFGSFVLVFSVSMGRGVQEAIVHEYSRYAGLRQIDVNPNYESSPAAAAEEKIEVTGKMSDEKRKRLRTEILRRERRDTAQTGGAKLTPERLQQLREIPHVASVTPEVNFYSARALLGNKSDNVFVHSAPSDHKLLRDRMIAGSFLSAPDENAAVVTEYLLYRLGITDDAGVQGVLGRKLRLEGGTGANKPYLLLALFNAGRARVEAEEQTLLDKVVKQLPAALERLDLTPAEKDFLKKTLKPPAGNERSQGDTPTREFTVVGVLRSASEMDPRNNYLNWWTQTVDVVLPVQTATDFFFAVPANREAGLPRAMIEADRSENVKEVTRAIGALGLRTTSLVELIEREQFTYLVLFAVMTCIAGVALLVAALGIINTMLMSVLERTREIGVMKAVGARHGHIQAIFLVEGALIGLTGGLLGLLVAWAVSKPADAWVTSLVASRLQLELHESLFVWPAWLLMGGPVFAAVVTTAAAVYPARRAARVNPIAALRHE
jgi:putative ABC transport system permease protein